MAIVNVSEQDFVRVAEAANVAQERGDLSAAAELDMLARKINAALSRTGVTRRQVRAMGGAGTALSWRDVPSTLR